MPSIDHLLQPSLNTHKARHPLHSSYSHFIVGFFGGPLGIFMYAAYSMYNTGMLKQYLYWYLGFFILVALSLTGLIYSYLYGVPFELSDGLSAQDIRRWGNRLCGILLMGIIYLVQKDLFSVSELEEDTPKPWIPGIASIIIAYVITFFAVDQFV